MHLSKAVLLSMALSVNLYAQDIKIVGTIDQTITIPQAKGVLAQPVKQKIKLLKMQLSDTAVKTLANRTKTAAGKTSTAGITAGLKLPHKIQLGMNNVPVLNQGNFGTCATFATTAAVDAAINKGDYISQLCQLQLGMYLGQNGYLSNPWEGYMARFSLSQMETYGVIRKDMQRELGCGGLSEYPVNDQPTEVNAMSVEQFHELSEGIDSVPVLFSPILEVYEAVLDRVDTNKTLNQVKVALNAGDRVTFGTLLIDFDLGDMGAVGSHHATFDTWVLTPEIQRDIFLNPEGIGGHEMVITGYDDDAIAIDENGYQHKGLLSLRNSWGDKIGDHGNFYISYDYFKVMVIEAHRIRTLPSENENPSIATA